MTLTGKIARLPREIREELNRRLHHGESGKMLVAWLRRIAPNCKTTDDALKAVKQKNPDFGEREFREAMFRLGHDPGEPPKNG